MLPERVEPAPQARVWLPVAAEPQGGPALLYLAALSKVVPVRAISQAQGDLAQGAWAPWAHLFTVPVGDALHWNIVVGDDESVLRAIYTRNLINIAIVGRKPRRQAAAELSRWHVWTMRTWSIYDYYVNTRYVPPERHAVANALVSGDTLGELEADGVDSGGHGVHA